MFETGIIWQAFVVDTDGTEVKIVSYVERVSFNIFHELVVKQRGRWLATMGHAWNWIHVYRQGELVKRFCRDCVFVEDSEHDGCAAREFISLKKH